MNKPTLILLLLLLLPFGASADDNVSLEIFLNSMNEYYVGVDGGSLQPCLSGMCNVTINRNITTNANISDDDIRKISMQTATELSTVTFATDSLNKSDTWNVVNDVVEKRFAAHEQFTLTTEMPQQSDFTNISVALAIKEGEVNTLQKQANGYDAQILSYKTTVGMLERKLDEYTFILLVIILVLAYSGIPQTQLWREWKTKLKVR